MTRFCRQSGFKSINSSRFWSCMGGFWWGLSPVHRWLLLWFPHVVESSERGSKLALGLSSTGVLIASWGFHSHDLVTSQRPCLQIPPPWSLEFQLMNFGEINIQCINTYLLSNFFPHFWHYQKLNYLKISFLIICCQCIEIQSILYCISCIYYIFYIYLYTFYMLYI